MAMSVAMLLTVFGGFASTYYLKGYFDTPALPLHVHIHGLALTSWYVLFFMQSMLVATRRTALHRRLGSAGVVLALAIVPITAAVNLKTLMLTLGFLGLVGLAVHFRRRPEVHGRLMLLAAIALLGAAIARLVGQALRAGLAPQPILVLFTVDLVFPYLLAMVVYDLFVHRRLHPVTLWGGLYVLAVRRAFFMLEPFG